MKIEKKMIRINQSSTWPSKLLREGDVDPLIDLEWEIYKVKLNQTQHILIAEMKHSNKLLN